MPSGSSLRSHDNGDGNIRSLCYIIRKPRITPLLKGAAIMKKKVLIIDDSPLVLGMVRDILGEAGYEVHTASNGIEANQHIFSLDKRPDLIILDIMMPML